MNAFPLRRTRTGRLSWLATRSRNLEQAGIQLARKEDHTVTAPTPATKSGSVAERLRTPARQLNPLQLPSRAEADRAAVGRPEGILRVLRVGQRLRFRRPNRAHPELAFAVRRPARKRQLLSIRRDD